MNININEPYKKDLISYDKVSKLSNQGDDIFKLVFGTDSGPAHLDPQESGRISSFNVIDQVCEGLFTYNLTKPDLPIIPRLATSKGTWMVNSTDTWYTVSLRTNVIFHDGTKFNATAVKFTFDRLKYFINNSMALRADLYEYYDPDLGSTFPIINDTVIIDEYTIRFELNKPYVPFEALLCFPASYILSPTSTPQFERINTTTGDLVGTGPFVYDHYIPDNEVEFHAFENYWAGRANITILKFSIIADATSRNNALLSGEIDLLVDPLASMFSIFDADPDVTLINAGQSMDVQYLGINNQMINNTWRNAISYAINYSYIIDKLYGGNAVRLKSPIPENMPYANWSFDVAIFNVTKAREIMQSMGFGVGLDPNYPGIHESNWSGATFRTYNYTYNIENTIRANILLLLQNNLDKIGIDVTDAGMSVGVYFDRLYETPPYTRNNLELFWLGWIPDYNDPSNYINPHFTNRSIASNGAQYNGYTAAMEAGRDPLDLWDNVQLLMEAALFETDAMARKVYYERIQQLLVEEDMPWAFGCIEYNHDAYRSHILGFQSNAMRILNLYGVTQNSTMAPQTIYIDGNQEWQYFKNAGKCTGQGTSSDPYVIEDLVIDSRNQSVSCIHIENSDVYFRIENCILYNSGGGANDAGLRLEHVSNAILVNLDCSNNNGHGVYLYDCEHVTILESNMNHNKLAGIFLNESRLISILNNTETISYNRWGIYLLLSHSNTISGSFLGSNQFGIFFNQSNYNSIINNFFNLNDEAYVEEDSYGNTFQGNTIVAKPDYLIVVIITVAIIVSIAGVSFVVVRKRVIIPKKGREIKVYDKKKIKIEEKLHNRLLAVDHLMEEKSVKEALKDLEEIKDLCKVYGLFEMLNECDEKITQCNSKYLEMINIIKRIVLNLATKFARLEITDISEQIGISDDDFIIEVLQEMIQNNEINGEYFSKSKAVAFDKQSNIEQIEQFIKIYREWEMLNLDRDDSELLLEEIRSEEIKPKAIVSKLLPEKFKELNIFLSYSTLDTDHFQILRVVKSLEEYPEIDKVMYWESDKTQKIAEYTEFMDETLNEYDVFVLFCSENSIKSAFVKDEWQLAFEKRKKGLITIIPVYEQAEHIPVILGHFLNVKYNKADFNSFTRDLYQEIMRSKGRRIPEIIA